MSEISEKKPVIYYVTRDIERALGATPNDNYHIVSNKTAYAESIKKQYPDFIHLIETDSPDKELLDTRELLDHVDFHSLIKKTGDQASILVFKNTSQIEDICSKNKWHLLNPSSALAEKIENKMTQVEYLGDLGDQYLPTHSLTIAKDIAWEKKPLIIQWAHSHTGLGTTLVNSADELKAVQSKFPERLARVTSYVHGPSFTINISVDAKEIYLGNISYQITGIPPFTENIFSTIGNDWSLTHSLLNEDEIGVIETMATALATKLQSDGWRGLFGIDVMRDDELSKIFLIEINARQPASTTFESQLQTKNREFGVEGQTIFEAHIQALTSKTSSKTKPHGIIPINDGSQIIQRITRITQSISDKQVQALHALGYTTILYPNTKENEDLLRIQSSLGIMETHGRFNKRGKEIVDILSA